MLKALFVWFQIKKKIYLKKLCGPARDIGMSFTVGINILNFENFEKNNENFSKIIFSVFSREINRKRIFRFAISLLSFIFVYERDQLQYFKFSKNQVRNMT